MDYGWSGTSISCVMGELNVSEFKKRVYRFIYENMTIIGKLIETQSWYRDPNGWVVILNRKL